MRLICRSVVLNLVAKTAEAAIRAKVDVVIKTIGKDLILTALVSGFINNSGVKKVVWESPVDELDIDVQVVQIAGIEIMALCVADE